MLLTCNRRFIRQKKLIPLENSNKQKVVALLKSIETGDNVPVGYINQSKR